MFRLIILVVGLNLFGPSFIHPQVHQLKKIKTSLRIFYNQLPDSLFINNKLSFLQNDTLLVSEPGIYEIRAVKSCYESYYKKVVLLPKHVRPINIILEQHESSDFKLFKTKFYINSGIALLGAIGYSQIPSGYKGHYILFGTLPIVHFAFNYSNFEPCEYEYIGDIEAENNGFRFYAGISMVTIDYQNNVSENITYVREGDTYFFIQNINRKIILKLNKYNPALNISVKKNISKVLRAELSLSYYPFDDVSVDIIEKFDTGVRFRKHTKKISSATPFMLEQVLDFIILNNIGQEIGLTFGAYLGNPFHYASKKFVFEIQQPYLPKEVYENESDTIKIRSANQYGTLLGFYSSIPLIKNISFSTKVKYYFGSDFNFFTINSGLNYKL